MATRKYWYKVSPAELQIHPKQFTFKRMSTAMCYFAARQGNVVGIKTLESAMFYGIPFSQPPVGDYRWRRPRDPLPFTKKYWNATFERPACLQICDQPASEYSCPQEVCNVMNHCGNSVYSMIH